MKKMMLLAGVASIVSLAAAATPAQADDARLAPAYGDIDPFYGDIDPFYGDIDPFYGDIDPFYGDIDPFYGDIDPFYGDIDPFYGDIDPFYGDIDPFYGDIDPFYGDIDPFYGDIDPFYGDIDAFYGDIEAFYGDIDPFYGDIDPFYGDIDPFDEYGDIDPFYGDIDPFYGDIDPFYGDIDPFYGDIDPFYGAIGAFFGHIDQFYGDIDPFYGDIDPFYGDIDPFDEYGDIDPFYGDIDPFYGDIDPFYGDIDPFYGDIDPFYGDIDPFFTQITTYWREIGPVWDELNASWGDLGAFASDSNYAALASDLNNLVARSEETWGSAVKTRTGQSFWDGFASDVLAKHGIDLNDPSSLEGMSGFQRASFFLDWYDGLMQFSGIDHLDHWMPMIRWSPGMAKRNGFGGGVTVGLLDSPVEGDADLLNNLVYSEGYTNFVSGHGDAVASLIVSATDGIGVMGIAQDASIANYNPYDDTGTASWEDVGKGIAALGGQGASVINMSLGIPGWTLNQEWMNVLSAPDIASNAGSTVLVKAAGNDGLSQTTDIDWDWDIGTQLLVVGSVNPAGRISSFSNKPGEACLLDAGVCLEQNKLKYRFLVAPGELLLTSDGLSGVTRNTGTSVAAPLVTGAITLLQSRWPWLKNYSEESADIILRSARDLGAPGVDSVYGWGLLDIEASQAPLNFNDLYFYEGARGPGQYHKVSASVLRGATPESRKNWDQQGAYFYAFEDIGGTYRDFKIPFSGLLVGQSLNLHGNAGRIETYLGARMTNWTNGSGFSDMNTYSAPLTTEDGWSLSMTVSNRNPYDQVRDGELPFQTGFVMENPSTGMTLQFGHGEGAMALTGQDGFGVFSDYDGETGGVNPILGLASGGTYAGAAMNVSPRTQLSFGVTQQTNEHFFIQPYSGEERPIFDGLEDYKAFAANIGASFRATDRVSFNASYTRLHEGTGLLGVQGLGPANLSGGASTDAASMGASLDMDYGLSFSASATMAHTGSISDSAGFSLANGGLTSSAYSFALAKNGVFGKTDRMRLSFGQSLHIENGDLNFASIQIVDRETGQIGLVNQDIGLGGDNRNYVFEALYAKPVLDGRGEISAFGRAEMQSDTAIIDQSGFAAGARFGFGF